MGVNSDDSAALNKHLWPEWHLIAADKCTIGRWRQNCWNQQHSRDYMLHRHRFEDRMERLGPRTRWIQWWILKKIHLEFNPGINHRALSPTRRWITRGKMGCSALSELHLFAQLKNAEDYPVPQALRAAFNARNKWRSFIEQGQKKILHSQESS